MKWEGPFNVTYYAQTRDFWLQSSVLLPNGNTKLNIRHLSWVLCTAPVLAKAIDMAWLWGPWTKNVWRTHSNSSTNYWYDSSHLPLWNPLDGFVCTLHTTAVLSDGNSGWDRPAWGECHNVLLFLWNICQITSKHIIICTSLGFWGFSCRDSWNISCINHRFSPMILKMSPGLTTVFWGIKNFWEIILRDKPMARSMCPFLAYWQVVVLFFLQLMDSNNLPD